MEKKVSIIIPAFNAEKWIRYSIESALNQTWRWKEVIIVDDGSKDATLKIAKSYEAPNVRVIATENRGASSARNLGLSIAQGEYIQWLDADDLLHTNKIEKQMKLAEEYQLQTNLYSGPWAKFINRTQKAVFFSDDLWEDLDPIEWMLRKMEQNLWMPPIVFLTNRKLIEAAGIWNEELSLNDDGEYYSRIISQASKVCFVRDAYCYKRSTVGLSHDANLSDHKLNSLWHTISLDIKTVREMSDTERSRKAGIVFLNRWALYFYPQRPDILFEMQCLAKDLEGKIEQPMLAKKYRMIQEIFGWKIAKKAQFTLPIVRFFIKKHLERFSFR